ncbi:PepSY-associated TM helix domain-containing protein [Sanguibacter suaedae]|uniref:PepSY domain-containing protein n=1 Tax=Sanguibacter suaedae TaxID=2795737 RepID=A0A934I823_9MICO|nr:PepSY-associated TM helix domain-containing protein [Sanguibacter suaedae]MBI9113707.1 PepSY domain-containing protein [Sanguibacter suaedae]
MTTTVDRTDTRTDARRPARGQTGRLLLRLHFYAGVLVGPFILVAALSGALYALSPQIEKVVYAHELRVPVSGPDLSLAAQVDAAQAATGGTEQPVAVRPAPNPGDTTRVLYAADGESSSRTIFVNPASGEIRGDLLTYGTSGALPLRTWISTLHRTLHLGDAGRLYSELAASWLGVVSLAGLGLWAARWRRTRKARGLVVPEKGATGYRRTLGWHASTGIWVLGGALFLSATGITWSQYAGANVSALRAGLSWQAPTVTTALDGADVGGGGEHAGHHDGMVMDAPDADPATFDAVLDVARGESVDTGLVEIVPPSAEGEAWVVQEIQRSYPTQVDVVAVDGDTLEVTDRVDFADHPFVAKLARWGIDMHQGTLFGLTNQIVLTVVALAIAALVVKGYVMWWQRRPTRDAGRAVGKAPARGALRDTPWWGRTVVLGVAVGVGFALPLVGVSLAAFVVVDSLLGLRARKG